MVVVNNNVFRWGRSIVVPALMLFACNKSKGIDQPDTDTQNRDTATESSSVSDSSSASDSDTGSMIDTDYSDYHYPFTPDELFDTDTNGDCVHPVVEADCQEGWCTIPPGCFIAGSPESEINRSVWTENQVQITLTYSFAMAATEVTQKQWTDAGFDVPPNNTSGDNLPVAWVNWFEAAAWCNAMSIKEGLEPCYDLSSCTGDIGSGCPEGDFYQWGCERVQGSPENRVDGLYVCEGDPHLYEKRYECPGYRLPTQAESEYATRAGTRTATYNGSIRYATYQAEPALEPIAWYCTNSGGIAHEVATLRPNNWGLYDLLGNLVEFLDAQNTENSIDDDEGIPGGPLVNPVGAPFNLEREPRGRKDSFRDDVPSGWNRAASMGMIDYLGRGFNYGFRPVRTLSLAADTDSSSD